MSGAPSIVTCSNGFFVSSEFPQNISSKNFSPLRYLFFVLSFTIISTFLLIAEYDAFIEPRYKSTSAYFLLKYIFAWISCFLLSVDSSEISSSPSIISSFNVYMVKLLTSHSLNFPSSDLLVISVLLHSDNALSEMLKSAITPLDKNGDITIRSLNVESALPFCVQNNLSFSILYAFSPMPRGNISKFSPNTLLSSEKEISLISFIILRIRFLFFK